MSVRVTITSEGLQNLGLYNWLCAYGLSAGRDLYSATPTVTPQVLLFHVKDLCCPIKMLCTQARVLGTYFYLDGKVG